MSREHYDSVYVANEWPIPVRIEEGGLSKRELFAAMAMQGILASYKSVIPAREPTGRLAVEFADALIAALAEKTP